MSILDLDLIKEFERLIAEGGADVSGHMVLDIYYNCNQGYHKWKCYEGFTDKYLYCELCDLKDTKFLILK